MRKVLAGILIFDVVMGILCLVVGTRQYAGDRQLNTREGKIQELRETLAGDVNCEEELAWKSTVYGCKYGCRSGALLPVLFG